MRTGLEATTPGRNPHPTPSTSPSRIKSGLCSVLNQPNAAPFRGVATAKTTGRPGARLEGSGKFGQYVTPSSSDWSTTSRTTILVAARGRTLLRRRPYASHRLWSFGDFENQVKLTGVNSTASNIQNRFLRYMVHIPLIRIFIALSPSPVRNEGSNARWVVGGGGYSQS